MEEWRDIKGFEGKYQVSNQGRVKSLNYHRTGKEKIMSPSPDKSGYMQLSLWEDKKCTSKKIHRLVGEAFIPNPESKPEIDHINRVRNDNRAENLRWCTHAENMHNPLTLKIISKNKKGIDNPFYGKHFSEEHKKKMSEVRKGKNVPNNWKKVNQYTKDGILIKTWDSMGAASKELNINFASISMCCNGKIKTSGGYKWEKI